LDNGICAADKECCNGQCQSSSGKCCVAAGGFCDGITHNCCTGSCDPNTRTCSCLPSYPQATSCTRNADCCTGSCVNVNGYSFCCQPAGYPSIDPVTGKQLSACNPNNLAYPSDNVPITNYCHNSSCFCVDQHQACGTTTDCCAHRGFDAFCSPVTHTCCTATGSIVCATNSDCCSGVCDQSSVCDCASPGGTCVVNSDCCNGYPCQTGKCCHSLGTTCSGNAQCCSGLCNKKCCYGNQATCSSNSNCCSGTCSASTHKCCATLLEACKTSSDCCSGPCFGGKCV